MPKKSLPEIEVPSSHDWRTTDEDEVNRRRLRAQTEDFKISNTDPRHQIFSNFRVESESGLNYLVEVRDLNARQFACDCVDFRINGLGTCKHVEAVLLHLERRFSRLYRKCVRNGRGRIEVIADSLSGSLRLLGLGEPMPKELSEWFDAGGQLLNGSPEEVVEALQALAPQMPVLRVSQELTGWLETRRRAEERKQLRREYEQKVQSGEWPAQETKVPLYPYQREGMLHLAFTERALLADEMGLGKTIQAIAACALLHRLRKAARVLVVTPASLKTEWEEQIQCFTDLPYQLVFGGRTRRLQAYDAAAQNQNGAAVNQPFFTIVNYEQMLSDALDVNARLKPDVVILDEAQRIKNWDTKTSRAIKRLASRYAFVLTGTPIENRIDELYSLMSFLDPSLLGPLFRFNREYYELDERGRPLGCRNLDKLHDRIKPSMLRRRKADVETELPERTDRNFFVPLSAEQQGEYEGHEAVVARLISTANRRPLTLQEHEKLMLHLAMMRMICDTNYILQPDQRACPKLGELEKLLEECRDNREVKTIVFSEWERMLELVRDLCRRLDIGFAWHTGSVPQKRRRAEINSFKSDPNCRVFLSTDSGASGLNLQVASVVINCDLPWNPARLEQRIARAWRKHQTRAVTIINLISENTIEHRMLSTLALKQTLADGVLDRKGDLKEIKFAGGRQSFMAKLKQLIVPRDLGQKVEPKELKPPLPADRALGFANAAQERINGALVRCEERYPNDCPHSVLYVVVERDAAHWREKLNPLHNDYFGPGQGDPLAPVRLEVIDRATDEALQRLIELGIVARTTRGARQLVHSEAASAPLSEAERQEAAAHRQHAARRLKMARLLGEGGLEEEARAAFTEAVLPLGRALAIEGRLPQPTKFEETLLAPLAQRWGDALTPLRQFAATPVSPWKPVADCLTAL